MGYVWIAIGCLMVGVSGISFCYGQDFWMRVIGSLSAIISAFSLWYGPHLLGQSKEEKKTKVSNQNVFSDSPVQAGRDVNFNQVVVKDLYRDRNERQLPINEIKVKIRRIIEDYDHEIISLIEKLNEEAKQIEIRQNRRNLLHSGITINLHLKRIKEFREIGKYKEVCFRRELEDLAVILGKSDIDELWNFPELNVLKAAYEKAHDFIENTVSGMLSEVNQLVNRLGLLMSFEQMKKENGF